MRDEPLRILQVSIADFLGGAERVAWDLFRSYRQRGHQSWLAVGKKMSADPDVFEIPKRKPGPWARLWTQASYRPLDFRGGWRVSSFMAQVATPRKSFERFWGIDDFGFPGAWQLLALAPQPPDIVHCHNLHGYYFDLRALPWLSHRVPVVLTLHDGWLLSGHCCHSLSCERWRTGCGSCPDLSLPQVIRRDATAYNWRRKHAIYRRSRLYVATPCKWLMQKVEESMLAPHVVETRVIPNGVDLAVFHPADKQQARAALGLPREARILLFTANTITQNPSKDYETMKAAAVTVAERLRHQTVLFLALGEDSAPQRLGRAEIRFVPFQTDRELVARYYQSADVYIHAALADTFPTTVLEALACGTPVVATAVGGIPEQIKSPISSAGVEAHTLGQATGILVQPRDPPAMSQAIERILTDTPVANQLGRNAAEDAKARFHLRRQVDDYLTWYSDILHSSAAPPFAVLPRLERRDRA